MYRFKSCSSAFGITDGGFVVILLCALCILLAPPNLYAQNFVSKIESAKHGGELVVAKNKSEVIRIDVPYTDLLVGNSKIADVIALTDRSVYVLGKALGATSLMIYGPQKRLISVLNIVVSHDVEGLKTRLHDVFPHEKVEVRSAAASLLLSGTVSSSTKLARILAIAKQYAPKPAEVVNGLTVKGSQQVMLAVRFAEVARTVVKELGLNAAVSGKNITIDSGDALSSGVFSATSFIQGVLGPLTFGGTSFTALFDALESKGLVKTLAEPNLIALSGDTANFLAGGEFPIPVSRALKDGGTTVTIEFKPFGVSLAFTPTVLEGDLINIAVAPEVSRIDPNTSVTLSGFLIPGLSTRRARTTIELRHGQSFAIAGMIQSDFEDTIRELPLINEVPILSTLFRRTNFQRNETELVIIVTPFLVKPAEPGTLTDPTAKIALPSDVDRIFFGRTDGKLARDAPGAGKTSLDLRGAGGVEGQYGHILQ
jgi:pilus assembly protein CpaC